MTENDYIAEYVIERRPEIIISVDYLSWRFAKALNNCMDSLSDAIDKCLKEVQNKALGEGRKVTTGQKLILAIKDKIITKDLPPRTPGRDFKGGYEELYLYKFKQYLSSVGRYIRNQQLKEVKYNGLRGKSETMNVDLLKVDFSKYESPIQRIVGEKTTQMVQQEEGQMIMQVSQQVGFAVDKDELLKALQYDRDQYKKGYEDGLKASKWISVEDRLPEKDGLHLVYTEEQPFVCTFENGEFFIDDVIAWMPLPQPYKPESEDNNG